jgi:hypothetical protein
MPLLVEPFPFSNLRRPDLGQPQPDNYLKWAVRFDERSYSYSIGCSDSRARTPTRARRQAIKYEYRFAEYEFAPVPATL